MQIQKLFSIVVLVVALVGFAKPTRADFIEEMMNGIRTEMDKYYKEEKLGFSDWMLQDVFPILYGQRPNNENGTLHQYKEYALHDTSNDDAAYLSGEELILRSGYDYQNFDAIADDGYITVLTRIINPLADKRFLRYPPVLVEHGGTIDPTAYLIGSSIQHHPEKWPRSSEDGPITSWNRSLAFVLANNGFDVWLAETRGSSDKNQRRVRPKAILTTVLGKNSGKNLTSGEQINSILRMGDYWDFSQDDIIAHEYKSHMDTVLNLTGAKELSLMTYSLSTPSSMGFLSIRPDYAEKVRGFISMAPIVSGEGVNGFLKVTLGVLCPLLPDKLGELIFTDILFTKPVRELILLLMRPVELRYTLAKAIITLVAGPSPKYATLLDLNLFGHILRRLSFREAKQMCQQMRANKLQKFDYGPIKNKLVYGQTEPPVYDLSDLKLKDWVVVAAANDMIASTESMEALIEQVNPKPIAQIIAPEMNHVDLIAGVENDKYVNSPILKYLESVSSVPGEDGSTEDDLAWEESIDIKSFLPAGLFPSNSTGNSATSFDPAHIFETWKKMFNLTEVFRGFDRMFKIGQSAGEKEKKPYEADKLDS